MVRFAARHSELCNRHDVDRLIVRSERQRTKTMFITIIRFLQAWRRYNRSLNELSRLGDRELADIGISRSEIPTVAWKAANA